MPNPLNEAPFTENYPQPADITRFQKKLTQIFGKEETTGRPWVRVIWMAADRSAVDEYGCPIAFDWDQYGAGGEGEWRRRYLYSSYPSWLELIDPETGLFVKRAVWTDIAPPRFAIERFIHPDEALRGWTASGIDSTGDKWTDRRPTHGRYEPLMFPPALITLAPNIATGVIAKHNGYCCEQAEKDKLLCYGQYAEPGQVHLDEFMKLKFLLDREREERPGMMTREQFVDANKRTQKRNANAFKGKDADIERLVKEAWRTHRAMLSEDPSAQKWGKYHFLSAHSKSGNASESKITLTDQ